MSKPQPVSQCIIHTPVFCLYLKSSWGYDWKWTESEIDRKVLDMLREWARRANCIYVYNDHQVDTWPSRMKGIWCSNVYATARNNAHISILSAYNTSFTQSVMKRCAWMREFYTRDWTLLSTLHTHFNSTQLCCLLTLRLSILPYNVYPGLVATIQPT